MKTWIYEKSASEGVGDRGGGIEWARDLAVLSCLSLGQELASWLPMTGLCCCLSPQADHFLSTGSCVRNSKRAPQNSGLQGQSLKMAGLRFPPLSIEKTIGSVSSRLRMQTCGELTLAWNGSLCRFQIHSHCCLWFMMVRLVRKEARSPTYFPIGSLPVLVLSLGDKAKETQGPLRRGPQ